VAFDKIRNTERIGPLDFLSSFAPNNNQTGI